MRGYEYVSVDYKKREVFVVGFGTSEHREIIDGNARIRKIDLVFEKDA